ncbi:protein kinase [Trypanosoma grayi]|uniref:protein kinase n=1 Tax=Trypanosoma grayi TaxID=71804 RepID=UPI0004F48149|nr:protein kinase [Trypanosoma grayi]KEG07145.1 protein kinase [Trypanosoma grayi]
MFKSESNPSRLIFGKRVVGTSSRLRRENCAGACTVSTSASYNGNLQASSHSCSTPPLGGSTLRVASSCVLEMLTAEPPLLLEGSTSTTTTTTMTPTTTTANQRRNNGFFLLNYYQNSGVEDDSVVVEAGEPSSPLACFRSSHSQSVRVTSPIIVPEELSPTYGAGEYTSSPRTRRKNGTKKESEKDLNHYSSKTSSRWHSSSVGGVTHSSVTRSQDSTEKGPMRVSLAHKALIGRGSFGVVFQAMDRDTNHIIAVKEIDFTKGADNKAVEAVRKELAMLKLLDHPHIVKCLGEECDESCLRIYLEYVSGGSISSVLRTFGPFQEKQASIYARQMLEGLEYLHSMNIMHRDLKGDNLLVDPHGTLKITDFGTAKNLLDHSDPTALAGTAYFMAPEAILGKDVGLLSDVWSVGCCVIEMLTGSPPFSEVKNQYALMMRVAGTKGELFPGMIPGGRKFSERAMTFLRRCLQRDPMRRPRMGELLRDPWIVSPPDGVEPAHVLKNNGGSNSNSNNNKSSALPEGVPCRSKKASGGSGCGAGIDGVDRSIGIRCSQSSLPPLDPRGKSERHAHDVDNTPPMGRRKPENGHQPKRRSVSSCTTTSSRSSSSSNNNNNRNTSTANNKGKSSSVRR